MNQYAWTQQRLYKLFLQFTSKILRKMEKQDGTTVTQQEDIVKETKYFYENLYKQEEQINSVNLEEIIQEHESIPKLTETM